MSLFKKLAVLFFLTIPFNLIAQNQSGKKQGKIKPPKLYSMLGSIRDSSVKIPVATAANLLEEKLVITDDSKNKYTVSSYQFMYRSKEVTEDESTGKMSPTTAIASSLFTTTPLPEFWLKQLKLKLKPGEELYFFDIIAKDAQGRVMYAPSLKIITQ